MDISVQYTQWNYHAVFYFSSPTQIACEIEWVIMLSIMMEYAGITVYSKAKDEHNWSSDENKSDSSNRTKIQKCHLIIQGTKQKYEPKIDRSRKETSWMMWQYMMPHTCFRSDTVDQTACRMSVVNIKEEEVWLWIMYISFWWELHHFFHT